MPSLNPSPAAAADSFTGPRASNSPPDRAALHRRLDQLHSAMGIAPVASVEGPPPGAAPRIHPADLDVLASLSSRTETAPKHRLRRAGLALLPFLGLSLWWMLGGNRGMAPLEPAPTPAPVVQALPAVPTSTAAAPSAAPPAPSSPVALAAQATRPDQPIGTDTSGDEAALRERIEAWRQAWAARDVDAYLSHYSPGFTPSNTQSHADWALARRRIISSRPDIVLSLSELQLSRIGPDRWKASFLQDYAAGGHVEKQQPKTLELQRENGRWNIVSERMDPASSRAQRP